MLMEQPCAPQELDALMRMYINGTSIEQYSQLLSEKCAAKLGQYSISFLPEVINEDPVRRYFESYFALYTLKNKLPHITIVDLQLYLRNLYAQLMLKQKDMFSCLLGNDHATILTTLKSNPFIEHARVLEALESDNFAEKNIRFTRDEKDKIWLVVLSMVLIWQLEQNCPMISGHIYRTGPFSTKSRGRPKKAVETPTAAYGAMKSYMPLPRNDQLLNSNPKFTEFYSRSTDLYDYDAAALVPKHQFSKLLHPFVG